MKAIATRALSDSELQQIHETSLKVLAEIGVDVCQERVRQKLLKAGAKSGPTADRVLLPGKLITEALEKCDRNVTLGSVRGEKYSLTPESRFYSSCCVDPFMLDYTDGKRPPKLDDCRNNARLIDALDVITMPYKMDVDYTDAVGEAGLLESNVLFLANMTKHFICAPHHVGEAKIWLEMCEIMAGGPLRENKIVTGMVSPISPLTLDKDFLDLVEFLVPSGIMILLLPCPLAGASAPFTLAGTCVDFNAENLAAIAVVQTLKPGAPVCYHNVAQGFNMRTSLSSLGGPEKALLGLAGADLGRFYKLPCGSAGTATDSGGFDFQNGADTMGQLLMTAAGPANLVSGIGSVGNGMATSAEQILFDCELIDLVDYYRKGIVVDRERLSFDALQRVAPGGSFLTDEHTVEFLHSGEHFYTGSFQHTGLVEAEKTMYEVLHQKAEAILSSHKPAAPEKRIEELKKYVRERKRRV